MAIDARHAQLRKELHAEPKRLEHYVSTVSERLQKSRDEALEWIDATLEENLSWLVDAVVEGVLIEQGRVYHPDEPPRSIEGVTNG